jgi:hypothetical protein
MEVWLAKMPTVFPFNNGRYADNLSAPARMGFIFEETDGATGFCAVHDKLKQAIAKKRMGFISQISGKITKQNVKD